MCYILRAAEKNYLNQSFPSLDDVSLFVQGLRYATTSMTSDDTSSIYSIVGPMPKPHLKISIPVRTSSKNNSPGSSNISQKPLRNLPGASPPWNEEKVASTGSGKANKILDIESGTLPDSSIPNDEDWDTCSGFSDSPTITSIISDDTATTTISLEPFWQYSLVASAKAAATTTDGGRPLFSQETTPGRWKNYKRKARRVASMISSSVKKIAAPQKDKDTGAGILVEEAEARYSAYPSNPSKEEENPRALFSAVLYSEVVPRCRSASVSAPALVVCRDGFWIKAKVLRDRKFETW